MGLDDLVLLYKPKREYMVNSAIFAVLRCSNLIEFLVSYSYMSLEISFTVILRLHTIYIVNFKIKMEVHAPATVVPIYIYIPINYI